MEKFRNVCVGQYSLRLKSITRGNIQIASTTSLPWVRYVRVLS